MMKPAILLVIFILVNSAQANSNTILPLNFIDAFNKIKSDLELMNHRHSLEHNFHHYSSYFNSPQFHENLYSTLVNSSILPNVTQECLNEFEFFFKELRNGSLWAKKGSFINNLIRKVEILIV